MNSLSLLPDPPCGIRLAMTGTRHATVGLEHPKAGGGGRASRGCQRHWDCESASDPTSRIDRHRTYLVAMGLCVPAIFHARRTALTTCRHAANPGVVLV